MGVVTSETVVLGKDCTITGLDDSVTDVSVTFTSEKADITTRGCNGWKMEVPTLKSCKIEASWIHSEGGQYTTIKTAYDTGATVSLSCNGISGNFVVSELKMEEDISGAAKCSATFDYCPANANYGGGGTT